MTLIGDKRMSLFRTIWVCRLPHLRFYGKIDLIVVIVVPNAAVNSSGDTILQGHRKLCLALGNECQSLYTSVPQNEKW